MKWIALAITLFCGISYAQSARDYYNDVYKAAQLDKLAAQYVCFTDEDDSSFFIFSQSKALRESMIAQGSFAKLDKAAQDGLQKDFLIVRSYKKGVAGAGNNFLDKADEAGDSWVSKERMFDPQTPVRMRMTIEWHTMRYKETLEVLNSDHAVIREIPRAGKCEPVAHTVAQKGN